MAAPTRDQVLSLLAAANNHGDLAVKTSSLKQAKDLLLSIDPSLAADLFPYLIELQSSPESLVRKLLIQIIEEIGFKAVEHSPTMISLLLTFLRDGDAIVVKQSIVSGTNIFCSVFEELIVQFQQYGKVERWLEDIWMWMLRFKDAVFGIAVEPASVGIKLLALKFLETFVLLFSSDIGDTEKLATKGIRQAVNVEWLVGGHPHPVLDPVVLISDANRTIGILLNLLLSVGSLPGCLTITVVNCWLIEVIVVATILSEFVCAVDTLGIVLITGSVFDRSSERLACSVACLAAIARKRPQHYDTILSALLDFDPDFQRVKGCHVTSIQYSFRTAFLGFLRCTYSPILESRERLIRSLRAMNAGDAADQVIRQVDKMIKNGDRSTRDARVSKDDQPSTQSPVSGELSRKRPVPLDNEQLANGHDTISKRIRSGSDSHSTLPAQINDSRQDLSSVNGVSANVPVLDSELTAVEQMIAVIGALLAEGERGAESLEILISKIHPDLLADIVITNMKHLPKTPPPLARIANLPVTRQLSSQVSQSQVIAASVPINSVQSLSGTAQASFPSPTPTVTVTVTTSLPSDTSNFSNQPADSKRDPRRDPRRLDPRRVVVTPGGATVSIADDTGATKEFDEPVSSIKPVSLPVMTADDNTLSDLTVKIKNDDIISEGSPVSGPDQVTPKTEVLEMPGDIHQITEADTSLDPSLSSTDLRDEDLSKAKLSEDTETIGTDSSIFEIDQSSIDVQVESTLEDTCLELPQLPPYIELSEEQGSKVKNMAVRRIIDSYKHLHGTDCQQFCMPLLARLVAQIDDNDEFITMLQKHILEDHWRKGHELVLHVLYHLHSLMILDSVGNASSSAVLYEKFLLGLAKTLLDSFPASDKSFSRLLGEVPLLPESSLKILNDLCYSDVIGHDGKIIRDIERVTQGLGAIWSLILGRPQNRQACLGIALKCAVHPQDEIRAKAIRLVTNKLFQLSYISGDVEKFATKMLLSAVDHEVSDTGLLQSGHTEQIAEAEVESHEISCTSQVSESTISENDTAIFAKPSIQSVPSILFSEAQRLISLFFALCTKKPSLLQIVFNVYGQAPKIVKQAFHRHVPVVVRALGQSYSELLHIISDPPQGSENLLTLVLQILTQDTTPSSDLISTVKHLYETKFRDVTILVPLLSSLSKQEVLPIFPRLVDLPLEKFQRALAHILQGSAHTGPALTPVEVLVAIHGIVPEKDGLALKKAWGRFVYISKPNKDSFCVLMQLNITDACSACFEQRTVFTQQVLAKALNQMVDQTPLPLLFMRTVIQAIDAFPAMVDFVMEILSKLVSRQVWRMPKLWVGFLKCVYQTQPRSFHVLLQVLHSQLA
ncbi:Symplekin [Glycine max]|nr:Symplekin [Glycine max]